MNTEKLTLTQEWDKAYPREESVDHKKVTFRNHFGIELAADMFRPKVSEGKLPAIAVCGAFGAVKEQHSGLYAQEMAKRGFLTIAFDPSFTGESGGQPRYMNAPDINVEDFQAAIDYLSTLDEVDAERISILGICGWGGMALQTACLDTRIKATVAVTMYDMSRVTGNGYFDSADNEEARHQARVSVNNQRTEDIEHIVLPSFDGIRLSNFEQNLVFRTDGSIASIAYGSNSLVLLGMVTLVENLEEMRRGSHSLY